MQERETGLGDGEERRADVIEDCCTQEGMPSCLGTNDEVVTLYWQDQYWEDPSQGRSRGDSSITQGSRGGRARCGTVGVSGNLPISETQYDTPARPCRRLHPFVYSLLSFLRGQSSNCPHSNRPRDTPARSPLLQHLDDSRCASLTQPGVVPLKPSLPRFGNTRSSDPTTRHQQVPSKF